MKALWLVCWCASNALAADPLQIAIYAPNAPFASAAERFAFISRLAKDFEARLGVPVQGRAFGRAQDLESAIKGHQVQLAVLDAVYLAERTAPRVPYPVLATLTSGGEALTRWVLYGEGNLAALEGHRISLASTGPKDTAFIGNALLDGELTPEKFFSERISAPDLASAVTTVLLKKAEAVFALEGMAKGTGLKSIFEAPRLPNPALCDVSSGAARVSPQLLVQVRALLAEQRLSAAVYDGWKTIGAEPYRALAAKLKGKLRRPLMADPPLTRIELDALMVPPQLDYADLDWKKLYWSP